MIPSGKVGGGRVLDIEPGPCNLGAGSKNLVLGSCYNGNVVLFHHFKQLAAAKRLADRDAFGNRRLHVYGDRCVQPQFARFKERIAVFALKRHNLREMVNRTGFQKMFERFHRTDKERAVADGQNNMFRDTAELFIHTS